MANILSDVESILHTSYIKYGSSRTPAPETYSTWRNLPQLGHAIKGESLLENSYLIIPSDLKISIKPFVRSNGQTIYLADQSTVPESVHLRPGGLFSESIIIAGSAGTISTNAMSQNSWKAIFSVIRNCFAKVNSYHVGPNAFNMLKNGARLVDNINQSSEYDLAIS